MQIHRILFAAIVFSAIMNIDAYLIVNCSAYLVNLFEFGCMQNQIGLGLFTANVRNTTGYLNSSKLNQIKILSYLDYQTITLIGGSVNQIYETIAPGAMNTSVSRTVTLDGVNVVNYSSTFINKTIVKNSYIDVFNATHNFNFVVRRSLFVDAYSNVRLIRLAGNASYDITYNGYATRLLIDVRDSAFCNIISIRHVETLIINGNGCKNGTSSISGNFFKKRSKSRSRVLSKERSSSVSLTSSITPSKNHSETFSPSMSTSPSNSPSSSKTSTFSKSRSVSSRTKTKSLYTRYSHFFHSKLVTVSKDVSNSATATATATATPKKEMVVNAVLAAIISPEVRNAIGGVISAVVPVGASQVARVSAALSLAVCDDIEDSEPSFFTYPFQYPRTYDFGILEAGIVVFISQLVAVLMYRKCLKNRILETILPVILMYFLPTIANDYPHVAQQPMAIIGAFLALLGLFVPTYYVCYVAPVTTGTVVYDDAIIENVHEIPTSAKHGFFENSGKHPYVETFGMYVNPLRNHKQLLYRSAVLIDMWFGAACAVLSGARRGGDIMYCKALLGSIFGISIIYSAYVIFVRPFMYRFDTFSAIAKSGAQLVICAVAIGFPEKIAIADTIGTVLVAYFPIELLVGYVVEHHDHKLREKTIEDIVGYEHSAGNLSESTTFSSCENTPKNCSCSADIESGMISSRTAESVDEPLSINIEETLIENTIIRGIETKPKSEFSDIDL